MESLDYEHESDPVKFINEFEKKTSCRFCESLDVVLYLSDAFLVCNNCGKHQFYGIRFHYLEETDTKITKENISQAIIDNESKYTPDNRVSGKKYYLIKKLAEETNKVI